MAEFRSRRDESRREAAESLALCRKAAASSGSNPMGVILGGNTSRAESAGRQSMADAGEQYTHFRGQVYTSVRPICQRIAGQPIRLARIAKTTKGKGQRVVETRHFDERALHKFVATRLGLTLKANEQIEVVDQHPVLDAIQKPAPSIPGWSDWHLKYVMTAALEITGHAYLWFPKVKGSKEIWYVPSNWIRPVLADNGSFASWAIRPVGASEDKPLPADEVTHTWYPDPSNPLLGLGPLAAGAKCIMVDEFVQEAQKNHFQLGIHPTAIVKVGSTILANGNKIRPRLKQGQKEQLKQAIYANWRGVQRFGEPLILDALIDEVIPYGNKPHDMDYGGNMDKTQARVEQTFGTNPYIAGAASLGSRAEAAEARYQFCVETVNPKIELLSRALTMSVLVQYDTSGMYVLFIEPCHPEDVEMDLKAWDLGSKIGAYEINDYRAQWLRLPPAPWGNVRVQVATTLPAGSPPPAPATSPSTAPDPETDDEQDALGESGDGDKAASVDPKSLDLWRRAVEARDKSFTSTWLKAHGDNEKSLAAVVMDFFASQADDVADRLEQTYGGAKDLRHTMMAKAAADAIFDPADWDDKLTAAVRPALGKIMAEGAKLQLDTYGDDGAGKDAPPGEIGYEFGVDLPPAVRRGVVNRLDESLDMDYWSDINQTTKDKLQAALQAGLDNGNTLREIIKTIRDEVFEGEIATSRAENIARTESTGAMNGGAHEAQKELAEEDIITGKKWLATEDVRTRETHSEADGQEIAVDEQFVVGGYSCDFPGDPSLPAAERCSCRCAQGSTTPFSNRAMRFLAKRYRVAA